MEGIYIDSITEIQGEEIINLINQVLEKMIENQLNLSFYLGLILGILIGFIFWDVLKGAHKNDNR